MKPLTMLIVSSLAIVFSGCSSTKDYLSHRGKDVLDIMTFSAGEGTGIKARASILNIGVFWGGDEVGLRSGNVLAFNSETFDVSTPVDILGRMDPSLDGVFCYEEVSTYDYETLEIHDPRGKNFMAVGHHFPFYSISEENPEYYTQFEVALGLLFDIRLGLNPGEFLDFLIGWTTADIYNDDEHKKNDPNQILDPTWITPDFEGNGKRVSPCIASFLLTRFVDEQGADEFLNR